MAALFNKDFVDFLEALDKHQVNFKNLADIEELEKKININKNDL